MSKNLGDYQRETISLERKVVGSGRITARNLRRGVKKMKRADAQKGKGNRGQEDARLQLDFGTHVESPAEGLIEGTGAENRPQRHMQVLLTRGAQ